MARLTWIERCPEIITCRGVPWDCLDAGGVRGRQHLDGRCRGGFVTLSTLACRVRMSKFKSSFRHSKRFSGTRYLRSSRLLGEDVRSSASNGLSDRRHQRRWRIPWRPIAFLGDQFFHLAAFPAGNANLATDQSSIESGHWSVRSRSRQASPAPIWGEA